jgi:hypothetical protein
MASYDDFVTFSDAVTLGGVITAEVLKRVRNTNGI